MHTNVQKLSAVVSQWIKPIISQVATNRIGMLPAFTSATEWIKKYFPVSPDYNIINDLSFLITPVSEMMIEPMISNTISKIGIRDENIPEYAMKIADTMLNETRSKGNVSLFNMVELDANDFMNLKNLLAKNIPVVNNPQIEKYKVIE